MGATIGVMVSHGADQLNVQRVLACRNVRDGRRALILSSVIIAPQFLLFLFVGVGLYAFYAIGGFDFGGLQPWDPTLAEGTPRADFVLPHLHSVADPVAHSGLSDRRGARCGDVQSDVGANSDLVGGPSRYR